MAVILNAAAWGQQPPPSAARGQVEKLGDHTYRVGTARIDTARREVTVPGTLNEITTVEFVANARDGAKAYESAITLDTDAVSFNATLLLIGLDPARSRPSKKQFDPVPPAGDPVDLFVEWPGTTQPRVRIEEILFDQVTKKTVASGPWVYSGSTFVATADGHKYLAELDGVLIGLMHGPSAIIDNPRNDLLGRFGAIILNPALAKAGMNVSVIIRALPLPGRPKLL